MNGVINDTRALLRLFQRSDYNDVHVRSGFYTLFMAKSEGRSNPIHSLSLANPDDFVALDACLISAPHVSSLVSILPVDSAVNAETIVARIELLGESIEIPAGQSGFVEAIFAQEGQLLDFGAPLARILS